MGVPRLPKTIELDDKKIAMIAHEIARDLLPHEHIFRAHGITKDQFQKEIEPNPFYKRVLEAAMIEWAATGSTKTRIQHQAALALETGIIPLSKRMNDSQEDLGKAVEAAKLLSKLAGIEETSKGPIDRFVINIDIGDGKQINIEKDITPMIEGTVNAA